MDRVREQLLLRDNAPTGRGVRVAVLDSGVDLSHPDLKDAVDLATSATTTITDSLDDVCYHGTHVAGVIAGRGVASSGRFRGVAPAAELVVLKINMNGRGSASWAIAAIELALQARVDIINYSVSFSPTGMDSPPGPAPWMWPPSNDLEEAFAEAARQGVLCVVAAGNDGPSHASINSPGGMEEALDGWGGRPRWQHRGKIKPRAVLHSPRPAPTKAATL